MDGFDGRDVLGVVIVCSSRGYSGRLPILFLLFHCRCILIFMIPHRIILAICSIPYEDCLAQRYLFCIYSFLGGIVVRHR